MSEQQKIIDALYLTVGRKQVAIESLSRDVTAHKADLERIQGEYRRLLKTLKQLIDGDIEADQLDIDIDKLSWRILEATQ